MDFEEWEPIYEAILTDFGYERAADERARELLVDLLAGAKPGGFDRLDFEGKTVAIAGPAATLEADLDQVRGAGAVVGVSSATGRVQEADIAVDCMVTDLDKQPSTARRLTDAGTPVAVHAHGDNRQALRTHVPTFGTDALIPTTQARPVAPVRNVGGFTDGDRAAFLADTLGAERLVFPGWDLDDPDVSAEKRRKLDWAERLLWWLERRRDERFELLDGRRSSIDTSVFE